MHVDNTIAATFFVYLAAMLAIGIYAYRRTGTISDYLLGGRKLDSFTAALSAGASDMSGWLLLGLPGYAYAAGYEAGWIALGLFIGTYVNWRFVAARLRIYTAELGDSITLSEYLENRFEDRSRLLRIVTAFFILTFFLFYTSSGLVAGGKLFESVFGLPYIWAVLAGALAVIVYTFLGGFMAVCWTDCVQGLLMSFALVLVPVVAISSQGGWGHVTDAMRAVNPSMLNPFAAGGGLLSIISLAAWGLGYFGQPHILVRFMAIRSAGDIPRARMIAMWWVFLGMSGALLVGFAGVGSLETPLSGADTEKVFILLVQSLLHPVPAGICLAAILAAIMSTADSQLLVASSALTEDFYKPFIRKRASERELVWVGRLTVMLIAAVAFALAMDPGNKVLDLVAFAWAGFGAAFGPTILMSLFWKRMTRAGAFAGIVTGGVTVFIWGKLLSGGIFDLYEIVPGFVLSLAAIVTASLPGRPQDAAGRLRGITRRSSEG
ncbi:MAG: sodium/proline symporter PutP [Candidatus Krumholzibacteria bacterium]|nr:sodium/proline symporter PutP [Candidatus Krumholzibacteria bacterium]